MTIQEILSSTEMSENEKVNALRKKMLNVPHWSGENGLEREYKAKYHPVMDKAKYPDVVTEEGIEHVSRIALGFQKLACKRMTELVTGIPTKRIYKPENEKQKEVAAFLEKIYEKNRIESINIDRLGKLFAGCEIFTLWFATKEDNTLYGRKSKLKLRCRTYTPMNGDELFPFFDEYGDMVAMSIGKKIKESDNTIAQTFDTYTADRHIKWALEGKEWTVVQDQDITIIGKIPGSYSWREEPIWQDTSNTVYEMEWSLSRDGNYLRENSKPIFAVFADEVINYGNEKKPEKEFKSVMQYPKGSTAGYITWAQAIDNLKFYVSELRNLYFTMLQLPDWSYEKMSQVALSGESRKQLFIDAELKVNDEKGPLIEFFDRETNVLKAFSKVIFGEGYEEDIDALSVKTVITPYKITDKKETVENLTTANGGKPLMSHKESIAEFGLSDDPDKTMEEIKNEQAQDNMNLTM